MTKCPLGKKSRFTDSQIISILKANEAGAKVSDLCCEHGMSQATFYKWRSKLGGMDDYNRECLTIDVGLSLPSERVIRALEQVIEWRGKPKAIRCDNGPEYISQTLLDWAGEKEIDIEHIQPGKPTQNAYIERFNRTVREECFDLHWFDTISEAETIVTEWMWLYNNERSHSAVGKIPPRKVLELTST